MPGDKDLDAAQASQPLYAWWLKLIPAFFGGMSPAASAPAADAAAAPAGHEVPFPLAQVSQALALTQQLLGPLYQGYLQALVAHPQPAQAFAAFQEQAQGRLRQVSETLAGVAKTLAIPTGLGAGGWKFATEPMALFGESMKPLALNLERAYGGLADAFGLAPSRALQQAGREMASASLSKQQAQAEYLGLVVGALAKGSEGLLTKLKEMGRRGESVDSLLALVRLWARAADEAMHAAMQSPPALQAAAKLIGAAARSRAQQQRVVAIASEALNVPTRAEVDEAYREIQELKRELRRLRKSLVAAAAAPVAAELPAPASAPEPTRARAPAAKRRKAVKVTPS